MYLFHMVDATTTTHGKLVWVEWLSSVLCLMQSEGMMLTSYCDTNTTAVQHTSLLQYIFSAFAVHLQYSAADAASSAHLPVLHSQPGHAMMSTSEPGPPPERQQHHPGPQAAGCSCRHLQIGLEFESMKVNVM